MYIHIILRTWRAAHHRCRGKLWCATRELAPPSIHVSHVTCEEEEEEEEEKEKEEEDERVESKI